MKVAATLTRFILARTRGSPLITGPDESPRAALPLQRCRRRRTMVFCTRDPSLTTPKTDFRDLCRGIIEKNLGTDRCRCGGVGLRLGWSPLFRREEDAWETVGGN